MPEIYNMRVIPKRASVYGLHADAVAAHPPHYRGMHFASCSCREGEVPNNDCEPNNHRGWNPDEIMPRQASLGARVRLDFYPRECIAEPRILYLKYIREHIRRTEKDSFAVLLSRTPRSSSKQEEFAIIAVTNILD